MNFFLLGFFVRNYLKSRKNILKYFLYQRRILSCDICNEAKRNILQYLQWSTFRRLQIKLFAQTVPAKVAKTLSKMLLLWTCLLEQFFSPVPTFWEIILRYVILNLARNDLFLIEKLDLTSVLLTHICILLKGQKFSRISILTLILFSATDIFLGPFHFWPYNGILLSTLSAKTRILCNKKGKKYHWDPRGIPRYTVNVPCSLQNVATGDEMSRQLTWGGKGGTLPCCPFYEVHSCFPILSWLCFVSFENIAQR